MRKLQLLSVSVFALMLSACTDMFGSDVYDYVSRDGINKIGTYNVLSTAVTMGTDKTISDHLVSLKTGKDCSTVRVEQGRTYCREDEPNPMPQTYCYRTIGDVTCYTEANPARLEIGRVGTY